MNAMPYRALGAGAILLTLLLSGCSSDGGLGLPSLPSMSELNPWKEKEKRLPGKRIAVLKTGGGVAADIEAAGAPIKLPAGYVNASWTQPGGNPGNALGHLALQGGLKTMWRVSAGRGSSSDGRLTASPIVQDGRIYVLDAAGHVRAFSASGGSRLWSARLAPQNEDDDEGYGGGIAFEGGRILAATGFGTVVALDARSGKKLWERALGVPIRFSPTAADGKIFVTTIEGKLYCLSVADGSDIWSYSGIGQSASIIGNVSPAVAKDVVVAPYPSGEVVALQSKNGEAMWVESLAGSRALSSLRALNNTARPVIAGGVVYAVGNSGRMVATSEKSGQRIWTQNVRSIQMPWVAGDAIYVVDTGGRMLAINRKNGKVRWMTRLDGAKTWYGPVLAGGKAWAVSSKGKLVGVDAATGRPLSQRTLGERVSIAPIVAEGRMYVLTDKANLYALR